MHHFSTHRSFLLTVLVVLISMVFCSILVHAGKDNTINKRLIQNGYSVYNLSNINGFLYVDGFVGKKPIKAIIDTGSNEISILSDSVSKIKGLKQTVVNTDQKSMSSNGKISTVKKVTLPDLTIGDIKEEKICAVMIDLPSKNDRPTLVIGNHFLQKYHAIIDTYNNKIYFRLTQLPTKTMMLIQKQLKLMQFEKILLMTSNSGVITLPVNINNESPVSFLLDTGTGITLVSQAYYGALKADQQMNQETHKGHIDAMTMNPLNLFFQKALVIRNIPIQVEDLSSMTKHLDVLGIIGLPQMIKAQTLIFAAEGAVFMRQSTL